MTAVKPMSLAEPGTPPHPATNPLGYPPVQQQYDPPFPPPLEHGREPEREREREAVAAPTSEPYGTAMQAVYADNLAKVQAAQTGAQRVAFGLSVGVRRGSAPGGPVTVPDAPPTALNVNITGTPHTGSNLTGMYTYFDPNGNAEGASTFAWLRDGVVIAGASGKVYALIGADEGHQISFRVTPVSTVAPTAGAAVTSPPVTASAVPG